MEIAVVFGGVFPVLPGQEDRVRNFEAELEGLGAEADQATREEARTAWQERHRQAGDVAAYIRTLRK